MITNKSPKNPHKYICENCNYSTCNKKDFNKHSLTAKHKKFTLITDSVPKIPSTHICSSCNKEYKSRMGLWKHSKKCNYHRTMETPMQNNASAIFELLKQNQDFKSLIIEQQKENQELHQQLLEVVKDGKTINNNTTNNNNNQKFNLNFFLNTTCKDAMNMSDFIEDIQSNFKDIENIGKNGYVSGMTNMILSRIKDLDITKRPLHCTDLKREIMYIKDNNKWCKDTNNNTKLRNMIAIVAKQNYDIVPLWRTQHPECNVSDHPSYNLCMDMMRNIIGDVGSEQARLDNKVIKNLSRYVNIN
jgi:hypothetical protein